MLAGDQSILIDVAIEKLAEITYTEFSSPSELECPRSKWIFDSFAHFPREHVHTRRLRNCHNSSGVPSGVERGVPLRRGAPEGIRLGTMGENSGVPQ
jgi:hypothetical protein